MKYQIKAVPVDFALRTTNLHIQVSERDFLSVVVDVQLPDAKDAVDRREVEYKKTELVFDNFSKAEFVMVNFWEFNYDDVEIVEEIQPEPGFYYVLNSSWEKKYFDPLERLNLVHFLLIGYDSYLEILANNEFKVNFL